MKKIACLLFLFALSAFGTSAQTTFVGSTVANGSNIVLTATLPVTNAGDTIFLDLFIGNATTIPVSITDTQANTYLQISGPIFWSPNSATPPVGKFNEILYAAQGIKGGANNVITVHVSVSTYFEVYLFDYAGVGSIDPPPPSNPPTPPPTGRASTAPTTTATSNPVTTTNPTDLLFAFFHSDNGAVQTIGSGWTGRPSNTNPNAEDQIVTATGTYSATMTLAPAANYVAFLVPFHATSNHTVTLNWAAPTGCTGTPCNPVTSYTVYRGVTSGFETILQNTGNTALTFTDKSVANGTTYFYEVTATNSCCESIKSNEVSVTIPGANSAAPNAPSLSQPSPTPPTQKNLKGTVQ
jgi:hypothetical protein